MAKGKQAKEAILIAKVAKVTTYKVVVSTKDEPSLILMSVTTTTRAWAGAVAKIAKENDLMCVITVPATVKERTIKIAGID